MLNNRNRGKEGRAANRLKQRRVCVCVDTYPASFSEIVFTCFTLLTPNYLSVFVYRTVLAVSYEPNRDTQCGNHQSKDIVSHCTRKRMTAER